jgi:hypothetical protein
MPASRETTVTPVNNGDFGAAERLAMSAYTQSGHRGRGLMRPSLNQAPAMLYCAT